MASYNLNEILKAKAGRTGNQVAARLDDVARVKVLSPRDLSETVLPYSEAFF